MIAKRSRAMLVHAFKDTGVITRRNLFRNIRMPQLVLFATVQPVMFLLLFTFVFGRSNGRSIPAEAGGK
jgi:ABC-2 type transport system permease protein